MNEWTRDVGFGTVARRVVALRRRARKITRWKSYSPVAAMLPLGLTVILNSLLRLDRKARCPFPLSTVANRDLFFQSSSGSIMAWFFFYYYFPETRMPTWAKWERSRPLSLASIGNLCHWIQVPAMFMGNHGPRNTAKDSHWPIHQPHTWWGRSHCSYFYLFQRYSRPPGLQKVEDRALMVLLLVIGSFALQ